MSDNVIRNLEASLGAQKSVWAAYRAYRKIKKSDFNFIISLIVPVVFLIMAILSLDKLENGAALSHHAINGLSEIFFSYSVGITGFLIAGVSILVSVNDKDLFIKMAETKYKQVDNSYSKYSQFQFIFFSLIVTLAYHLILLTSTVLLKFVTAEGAFFIAWIENVIIFSDSEIYFINCILLTLLAWLFTRCLLLVKSVIWNIYQMIVLTILWANHVKNNDNNQAPTP